MNGDGRGNVNKHCHSCCLQTLAVQFTGGGGGEIGAFCKVLVPPEAGSFPFRMAGHMHSPRNKPRTRIEDESGIVCKIP